MNPYVQQLEEIITKEQVDKLVPFLQSIPTGNTEELRKKLKSLNKQLNTYMQLETKPNGHSTWGVRGTQKQLRVLHLAGLGLFDKQSMFSTRNIFIDLLRNANFQETDLWPNHNVWNIVLEILQWRKADWLTECLNHHQDKNEWFYVKYSHLRQLLDLGLIEHDKKLFVRPLINFMSVYDNRKDIPDYYTIIKKDPFLLKNDLFSIFDYATNVNWINSYSNNGVKPLTWQEIFVRLADEGVISRNTILQKSLGALKRDFNKNLLGWFKDLFNALNPTTGEKTNLQHELFELCNCTTPLPVNFAVEQVKSLYTHAGFDTAAFLTNAESVLSRNDAKTSVKTLLGIFEKLAKTQSEHAPQLCLLAASAFLINDGAIQEKAAKLIKTFGDPADEMLAANVSMYAESLPVATAEKLSSFLANLARNADPAFGRDTETNGTDLYEYKDTEISVNIAEKQKLTPIDNWNDLLFHIGKTQSTLDAANLELLFDGIIRLQNQLPADYREQLKPYFSKAMHPVYDANYKATKEKVLGGLWGISGMLFGLIHDWSVGLEQQNVGKMNMQHANDFLLTYQKRFLQVIDKLNNKNALPLLATPTHAPHWIDPETLVERLFTYQQANAEPDYLDLSVAIARTILVDTENAQKKAEKLDGFYKDLMLFFLGDGHIGNLPKPPSFFQAFTVKMADLLTKKYTNAPKENEQQATLWAVAARTKFPMAGFDVLKDTIFGDLPNVAEPFTLQWKMNHRVHREKYSWQKEEVVYEYDELLIDTVEEKPTPLGLLYTRPLFKKTNSSDYYMEADIDLIISLLPQNPEPFYTRLLRTHCVGADTKERIIGETVRTLLLAERNLREATTLLLATSLLNAAPVTRGIAVEVVIQTVSEARLNTRQLGENLGKLIVGNYAPVQRLVDALTQIKGVSATHDTAIAQLLENLFAQLTAEPPKNLKKLLELYADLCAKHKLSPTESVKQKAAEWQKNATLKKVAGTLV